MPFGHDLFNKADAARKAVWRDLVFVESGGVLVLSVPSEIGRRLFGCWEQHLLAGNKSAARQVGHRTVDGAAPAWLRDRRARRYQ